MGHIRKTFGDRVCNMIRAVSKNKKPLSKKSPLDKSEEDLRFEMYLIRFTRYVLDDPETIFIKMADQIDNAQTFHVFSAEKRERKIREITDRFLPLYDAIMNDLEGDKQKELLPTYQKMRERLENSLLR